ncbi:MAG: hypothetical protein H6R02_985 [Burkholderiaceae bacterium]|nr:hypothetical protein [Burkholderiaceae bacterium]
MIRGTESRLSLSFLVGKALLANIRVPDGTLLRVLDAATVTALVDRGRQRILIVWAPLRNRWNSHAIRDCFRFFN